MGLMYVEPKKKRTALAIDPYFIGPKANLKFVSTGCTVLDCALGNGLALGRVSNVVGDKSTGKTGIGTEVMINFMRQYPGAAVAYRDAEAAFDTSYAEAMGLPLKNIDFGEEVPFNTVEDFERDFNRFIDARIEAKELGLYILDSLDALSDEAEMERDIGKGAYGGKKAAQMAAMFRKLTRKVEKSEVLLLIISQIRENIGVTFGEKYRRSGGKALDHHCSQIVWLSYLGMLKRTINKVERPYGIKIRAKVKKSKIGLPFREADYQFIFGFGIDDLQASIDWLKEVNRLDAINVKPKELNDYLKSIVDADDIEYNKEQKRVAEAVKTVWRDVERTFLPLRRKYNS